ncbi:hypothetical protein CBS9595_004214 [Malassezia furfur]|nr:hypothetical protein CBS9595_004214 [Malassezia furfur]
MDDARGVGARRMPNVVRRVQSRPRTPNDVHTVDLLQLGSDDDGAPGPSRRRTAPLPTAPPPPVGRSTRAAAPLQLDGGTTKGHTHARTATALDRLEDWLGLRSAAPAAHRPRPTPAPQAPTQPQPGSVARTARGAPDTGASTVDVLVHTVAPSDTVEGIALRYGADARVVRRSNRLWPGDAAQMRERIYIPVVSCKWRPADAHIQERTQHADGSFHPPDAGASVAREQVGREALGFFGAAPAPYSDHGESGVDDLLRLQQARRERTDAAADALPLRTRTPAAPSVPVRAPAPHEDWRPNVWTFGPTRARAAPASPERETLFDAGDDADDAHAPSTSALGRETQRATHTNLLDDLLRGPPTNTGAAANWVRPIHWGESLPAPPGARAEAPMSFASLLGDMAHARARVEDAVGAAMSELRHVSLGRSAQRARNGDVSLPM